jgi:TatD DNase family protein
MIFETHAHYDDPRFDADREELLSSLPAAGIGRVINVGADMASSRSSLELAEAYDFIYAAVGVHPSETTPLTEADMDELAKLCRQPKVAAIGEIGLDYHFEDSNRELQRKWFERQLRLASDAGLPVIIHSRDAAAETFDMIKASGVRRGVIHCYSGSAEMAADYVRMGFYLGIGGMVTFKKTRRLREVVEKIPLEHLLLETDCPYLAPEPHRGERNSSKFLTFITSRIADIKNITDNSVERITAENASALFKISLGAN